MAQRHTNSMAERPSATQSRQDSHGDPKPVDSDAVEVEPADSVLRAVAHAPHVEPGLTEGDVVDGNFSIEGKLGVGGMGAVYLARDLRLHRQIALKLHRRSDGAQRTEREARVLARLVHPNVVTVHDVGSWQGRTYIAMEYLDGGTLWQWLGARRRSWRELVAVFIQAARGLEAAHQAGLVHRDFKPQNVLLGTDGRICVADFGLARPLRGAPPDESNDAILCAVSATPIDSSFDVSLTATGACVGTPGYMAPEAERGAVVDARADQYSFCAALRAALVERNAPSWINPLIERGLQPDPGQRHLSMGVLLDALERGMRQRRRWFLPTALAGAGLLALLPWMITWFGYENSTSIPGCPTPVLPALYVNATAAPDGNGSVACPFRTLTQALAVTAHARVLHVAAGRYDAQHGEQFPLIVRRATEVRGAGADVTVIAGIGYFDSRPDGLAASRFPQRATLVVGDDDESVVLSGISVNSGQQDIMTGSIGIFCTRGNLHAFEGPEVPQPNTRLEHLAIGAGYETGLLVTGGTLPRVSGCNLSVTGGFFHDSNVGVWQVGCGAHDMAAPTALAVEKSSFRAMRSTTGPSSDATGVGIKIWDCAKSVRIVDNLFSDSDGGMWIARHQFLQPSASRDPQEPPVRIERNEFVTLSRYGIYLERAVYVELLQNLIGGSPVGISINSTPEEPPQIYARRNIIDLNTIAIEARQLPEGTVIDFGRSDDPGHNMFKCNALKEGTSNATVRIETQATPGIGLQFVGNKWDRIPPRVRRTLRLNERAEVLFATDYVPIDVGKAVWNNGICLMSPND